MIFWKDGVAFAGLGVLKRRDDPAISPETCVVASALQRYFEPALQRHPYMLGATLSRTFGLTPREIEVVHLLASGAGNGDIADILGISVATVKTHVRRCFDKLGVKSRFALLSFLSAFR
jgi:DNA-binding CsgD family transcriptional regulator